MLPNLMILNAFYLFDIIQIYLLDCNQAPK